MVSQEQVSELKARLLHDRERLEGDVAHLRGEDTSARTFQDDETDAVDQHPADDGSEMFEREKNLTLIRELEASLAEIHAALERMDEGSYGTCARCGKEIPVKRLEARPEAIYDVECQGILERELNRHVGAAERS